MKEHDDALKAKAQVIHNLSMRADQEQWPWYRAYLEEHYAAIVAAIRDGRAIDHGFRGVEVEDELKRLGLLVRRRPVDGRADTADGQPLRERK